MPPSLQSILEHFHLSPKKSGLLPVLAPTPQPLETTNLLFVSMDLPVLDSSCQCSHTPLWSFVSGFFSWSIVSSGFIHIVYVSASLPVMVV